jgi:phospholipid N-methyltransferase
MTDTLRFLRAWISNPTRIAAVAPSFPSLAQLITAEITVESAPVVELGPGTGVFTEALLKRGVPEHKLVLVELESAFARLLETRFPQAKVYAADAARVSWPDLVDCPVAGAVVSGLPLLSMPPRKVFAILSGAFDRLRTEGAFYQFTYGPGCPVRRAILDRLGLRATRVGTTFANLPPASVYRIRRRGPFRTRKSISPALALHRSAGD